MLIILVAASQLYWDVVLVVFVVVLNLVAKIFLLGWDLTFWFERVWVLDLLGLDKGKC